MLAKEFVIRDENKCKALITADVTLYFNRLDGLASGITNALNVVLPMLSPHVRWYRTESMSKDKKTTKRLFEEVISWFVDRFPEREEYGLVLTSGDTPEDVGPWGLTLSIEPDLMETETGYIQISLPIAELQTPSKLFDLAVELANNLFFRSGHAGYSINYEEGEMNPWLDAQMRAWHNRYQALDARDLASSGWQFCHSIKGVGWLTLLDLAFVEQLGGIEAIQKKLPLGVNVQQLDHGVIIQAGNKPVLGDKNRQEDLSDLRAVNDLISPIRIKDDIVIRAFGDMDGTKDWIERLDDK